jgi:hypothetical protein
MMNIFNKQAPMLSPQLPSGRGDMMPTNRPNMDLDALMAICGPGMQGPAGGNGRVGYRTANGDTGLQGANMPQPQRPSWLEGLFNPQPSQRQLPSAPWQTGMRAGSVGNQMGGLNNMYSNFAAPSPMPAPPPPMFGAPVGNSNAMMGPKPVGLF